MRLAEACNLLFRVIRRFGRKVLEGGLVTGRRDHRTLRLRGEYCTKKAIASHWLSPFPVFMKASKSLDRINHLSKNLITGKMPVCVAQILVSGFKNRMQVT